MPGISNCMMTSGGVALFGLMNYDTSRGEKKDWPAGKVPKKTFYAPINIAHTSNETKQTDLDHATPHWPYNLGRVESLSESDQGADTYQITTTFGKRAETISTQHPVKIKVEFPTYAEAQKRTYDSFVDKITLLE